MNTCTSSARSETAEFDSYSLKNLSSTAAPKDFEQLERWLSCEGGKPNWDGKIYVARTIQWETKGDQFLQKGCSPNFHAGWWSLACCKYDMCAAKPFRDEAADGSVPTYVFTLARSDRKVGQPLVGVAQIDQYHFNTMQDYAQFLLKRGNRTLISSRLTRERHDDGLLGWRFGDCHADMSGELGEPNPGHVHHPNKWWKEDINRKHLILVSDRFLLWHQPVFVAAETQKQSRFGTNIVPGNLHQLLRLG